MGNTNNIGKYVRARRTELGMTMEELAKLVGYKDRSTINKIEKGELRVQPEMYDDFAKALKTDVPTLCGWSQKVSVSAESYIISDSGLSTIVDIYSKLPDALRARLLAYCQGLYDILPKK